MYVLYFLSFFSCCFVVLVLVLCFVHSFRRSSPPLPPSFWESLYPVFLIMWRMTGPFGRRRVHRLPRSQARGHFSLFLTVYKLFLFISQHPSIPVLLRITVYDCDSRRVTTTRPGGLDYSHSFDDPHIVVFVSVHVDTSPPLLDAQYPVSNLIHRDCIAPFMLFAHPTSTQCYWILRYRRCDCHQASTHKSSSNLWLIGRSSVSSTARRMMRLVTITYSTRLQLLCAWVSHHLYRAYRNIFLPSQVQGFTGWLDSTTPCSD